MKEQNATGFKQVRGWLVAASAVLGCLPASLLCIRGMPWTDCLAALIIGLGVAFSLVRLCFRRFHGLRTYVAQQAACISVSHAMSGMLNGPPRAEELAPGWVSSGDRPFGVLQDRLFGALRDGLRQCIQALEADAGIIMLWDQRGKRLVPITQCRFPEVGAQEVQPIKPEPQLQRRVLLQGEPLALIDPQKIASLGDHPAWREMSACLCVPLPALGGTIGMLVVGHRQRREFTAVEIGAVQAIGQHMGMAMANAQLYERNCRAMEKLAMLQEIDQQVTAILDADEVCEAVVNGARRLVSADTSFLGLWKPTGELALAFGSGMRTTAFREICWSAGEGLAVRGQNPFIVTDGDIDSPPSDPGGFIAAEGLRAWIGAPFQAACPMPPVLAPSPPGQPILADKPGHEASPAQAAKSREWEEVRGILYVANRRPTSFDSHQAQLLANLAGRTAISIANAGLFRAVERSKQEWEVTVDAIEDRFLVLDPDYTIRRCNRAAAEALGLTPRQVVGRKCCHLLHHQAEPVEDCPVARSLCTGEKTFVESTDPHTERVYHKWAYPLFDAHDQIWAVVEYSRDVTAFQRAQVQLLQEEKLSALRQTISGAAHELNNPLTVIMGYAQLLQDSQDLQEIEQGLSSVHRQAQRAREVVENLLTFAPVGPAEGRPRRDSRQWVDVNQLLQHTLSLRAYTLRQKGVEVITDLASDLPLVFAEGSQFQQVFLSIVTNAEQALEQVDKPRRLTARTGLWEEGDILISFTDNGPGIPPSAFSRLFTPFFTTREAGKGPGLGLSTSYGIVEEHGGRIWAQNNPDAGATFFITLPIAPEGEEVAPDVRKVPSPRLRVTRPRILVIDDEYSIVALLQRFLEPLGYEVDGALGGDALFSLLEKRVYDLVITDIKMPGTDGRQIYAIISERYPTLRRRLIFTTGDTANVQTQRFLRERGVACLTKPFDLQEVQRVVQERIEEMRLNWQKP